MVLDSEIIGRINSGAMEGIKGYLGLDQFQSGSLCEVLKAYTGKYGLAALCSTEQLREALRAAKIPEMEIGQACLLTGVRGFKEMLANHADTKQLYLNRFVYNAIMQTGLTRDVVLRLTADFAWATGYEQISAEGLEARRQGQVEQAFIVPWNLYANDLKVVEMEFSKWRCSGTAMTVETINRLRTLSQAKIPEAQYCLGYYLLQLAQGENESNAFLQTKALAFLRAAAESGEQRAAAALGDYYYESGGPTDWEKAFSYYTGYGALALRAPQRVALTNILNHKKFNKHVLSLCGGFLVLIFLSVFAAPGSLLYGAHLGIGLLCGLLCGGTWMAAVLHHRAKPYDNVYYVPVVMLVLWSVYLAIRLLF